MVLAQASITIPAARSKVRRIVGGDGGEQIEGHLVGVDPWDVSSECTLSEHWNVWFV